MLFRSTFEEFFEAWAWRQLQFHDKPVGLLNLNGYYDRLLEFMTDTVQEGFVSDWQMDLIRMGADPESLLPQLIQDAGMSRADGLNQI